VRAALLWNQRSPIRPPSTDPSPLVRAHHPETAAHELAALACLPDLDVLAGIPDHANRSLAVFDQLSKTLGIPPLGGGSWPSTLMADVPWELGRARYPRREDLIEAVRTYHRALGVATGWDPDERVIAETAVELRFFAAAKGRTTTRS
jgi:hypothetical protein